MPEIHNSLPSLSSVNATSNNATSNITKEDLKQTGVQTYIRPIGWLLAKMKIATAVKLDGQTYYFKTKNFTNFIKSLGTHPQNLTQTASKLQEGYAKIFGKIPDPSPLQSINKEISPPKLGQNTQIINKDCQTLQQGQPLSKSEKFEKTLQKTIASLEADTLSFDQIEELKRAKKEIKLSLKNETLPPAEKESIRKLLNDYNEFIAGHEILSSLKKFGKQVKHSEEYPQEFKFFINMIGSGYRDLQDIRELHKTDKAKWQTSWNNVRKKIWNASIESKSFLEQGKQITFVTGSQSTSLPLIMKISTLAPNLSQKPALVPTGKLQKHHIAPLTGELEVGVGGVNKKNLSGMKIEGLNVSMGYAQNFAEPFNIKNTINTLKDLSKNSRITDSIKARLHLGVLQTLRMGSQINITTVKKLINDRLKKETDPKQVENLKDIYSLFGTVEPYKFTKDESSFIKKPFPIVWASVSITPQGDVISSISDEQRHEGNAILGEDIQIVFTDQKNMEKTRQLLKDTNVKVYSFDAASFIAHVQSKQNAEIQPPEVPD